MKRAAIDGQRTSCRSRQPARPSQPSWLDRLSADRRTAVQATKNTRSQRKLPAVRHPRLPRWPASWDDLACLVGRAIPLRDQSAAQVI